jgi:hypothetical protein
VADNFRFVVVLWAVRKVPNGCQIAPSPSSLLHTRPLLSETEDRLNIFPLNGGFHVLQDSGFPLGLFESKSQEILGKIRAESEFNLLISVLHER